jgi:hypothetical protein
MVIRKAIESMRSLPRGTDLAVICLAARPAHAPTGKAGSVSPEKASPKKELGVDAWTLVANPFGMPEHARH